MPNKFRLILLSTLVVLLNSFYSSGQDYRKQDDKKRPIHYETPGDKYMPASTTIKKNSPDYQYKQLSRSTVISSIVTIQVNVNSNQQNILGDAANEPNIALNPLNGRIDAIWLDNRAAITGSDSSALYYTYSIDQGNSWSINEKLSVLFDPHAGYPNQSKMGDYFDMISENLFVHLAWANTLNGEQDVYYSIITPPITASVDQLFNNNSISIFPNPNSGIFTIAGGIISSRVELINVIGEIVNSFIVTASTMMIDISSQPAGIYFLKIIRPNNIITLKKIVKE